MMPNWEEINAFFNNMERETKAEIKRENAFVRSIENQLMSTCYKCYPEYKQFKASILPRMKIDLHECAISLNEIISYALFTKPENKIKHEIPKINYDLYKDKSDDDELDRGRNKLRVALFETAKKTINKYWPELQDMESEDILSINFSAWVSTGELQTAFIYITQYDEN